MSDDAEQQVEEIEVLKSIYEGDENFKQLDAKTYQYKVSPNPTNVINRKFVWYSWSNSSTDLGKNFYRGSP